MATYTLARQRDGEVDDAKSRADLGPVVASERRPTRAMEGGSLHLGCSVA
jgi:hypothetical protein